jgi:hypothetical protein
MTRKICFKNIITRDETWVCGYEAKQVIAVEDPGLLCSKKDASALEI